MITSIASLNVPKDGLEIWPKSSLMIQFIKGFGHDRYLMDSIRNSFEPSHPLKCTESPIRIPTRGPSRVANYRPR